jgi:hypothetical protein
LKVSLLRKSDLVAGMESLDTLASAGKDLVCLLVTYLNKTTPEMLAILAKKNG